MNEIFLLNDFFFTYLNVLTTKSHKLLMEIKFINPWGSEFGVSLKIKVENHTTG
jgi:hypothetical protein